MHENGSHENNITQKVVAHEEDCVMNMRDLHHEYMKVDAC